MPQRAGGTADPKAKAGSPWPPKESQEGLGPHLAPGWKEGNEGSSLVHASGEVEPYIPTPRRAQATRGVICPPEVEEHPSEDTAVTGLRAAAAVDLGPLPQP